MEEIFQRAAEASTREPNSGELDNNGLSLPVTPYYSPELLQADENGAWNPIYVREGIRLLHSYSLIKVSGDYCYSVHPLVHQWARDQLKSNHDSIHKSAAALLSLSITSPLVVEDYAFQLALIPHIRACTSGSVKQYSAHHYEQFAEIFLTGGYGKYAEELILEALEIRTRLHGSEGLATLSTKASLAEALWAQGQWNEAEELEVQVLNARQKLLGTEHPDTLKAMSVRAQAHGLPSFYCFPSATHLYWYSYRLPKGDRGRPSIPDAFRRYR